jgi:CheY-like chemotaxis protein
MKPISILYLEDSPVDAELALSLLKAAGIQHTVRRVETEEDFLAALQEGSEDLILADYVLPQFDGMTALEYARQHRPETPFVFVSGAIGEELAIDSLHHGATACPRCAARAHRSRGAQGAETGRTRTA